MGRVRGVTIGLTVLAVLAAAVGVAVLVRVARRRAITASTVIGAVVVAAAVVLIGAVIGVAVVVDLFGLAHLVYLSVVLTVPLVGAAVLVLRRWSPGSAGEGAGRRRGASTAATVLAVAMLMPAPLGIYATHVAPYRLRVESFDVTVPEGRAGRDEVVIAVLSDLQTVGVGAHERAAVQAVLDAEPDVILIPGDLFQGGPALIEERGDAVRALLARLEAPGGVYFVQGDVDRSSPDEQLLGGTGIEVLDDEVRQVDVRDRTVLIGGTRKDYDTASAQRVRDELVAAAGGEAITVLMSHRPDTVLELPTASGVDLTVAGHTHGGQIALPGFGPLVTLSSVPRHVGAGGLHEVDGNRIYVSPGIGMERGQAPQVRFGVRPTIAVLHLVDDRR